MATNNEVNVSLSGQTGTGTFVGSASPTLTGTPLLGGTPYALGIITPWVAYTPTFTACGTVSAVSIWSRRVGGDLEIQGVFTSGTSTAAEARMTLGFNGSNSNVTSSNTVLPTKELAGTLVISTNLAGSAYVLIEQNIGYVTFSFSSAGANGYAKANGSTLFGTGTTVSLRANVAIDTWP